jgi:hypothetical protein
MNIHVSKYAQFDLKKVHHPDNEIHLFTQYFLHPSPTRKKEIAHCLKTNYINPYITRIHLLNEKIYTNEELGGVDGQGTNKITQTNIGKRLSFKDIFAYIRINCISGYCLFTNADIFFDSTVQKIRYSNISTHKEVHAILRYEYKGGKLEDSAIFGPRYDSQDTWIFHYSRKTEVSGTGVETPLKIKECHEKALDIEFGRPGCDNKIAYMVNILGGEIINDPQFIKTYHYHTETQRNYTHKDALPPPYTLILPAGFNPYEMVPSLGIDITTTIQSTNGFQQMRFDDNDRLYNYIQGKLERGEKFVLPRISGHENNYAFFGKIIQSNIANGVTPVVPENIQSYLRDTIPIMKRNAGIRISGIDSMVQYSNLYMSAFENCDMYGGWESWGHYIPHIAHSHEYVKRTFFKKQIYWSFALDIFHYIYGRPFTTAMRGKRILIVSPFCDSIRAKAEPAERVRIYDGVDLFPDCSFVFIKPPVTNGDNHSEEFGVELSRFCARLDELRGKYDIALLSCGGYANPIANYIYENHGASAIYVGGVLQMYFGIYGVRWMKERPEVLKLFMNKHWTRPGSGEKPANFSSIEGGCYW